MTPLFPTTRLRRFRQSEALRSLVRETAVTANDLIQPIFIEEGIDDPLPIAEMPGVSRIPERKIEHVVEAMARDGVKALMLFGISHHKDAAGSDAWNRDGLVARMVRRAKRAAPGLVVIPDICFCEYTDHGHCGVIEHDHVANDPTIENLARQAVVAADSDDGRPGGGDPPRAGCGRTPRHADHGLFHQVRLCLLRPVPRCGGVRVEGRPQDLPDGSHERPRGAARVRPGRGRRRRYADG
jgi:hypothetical protein